MDGFPFIIKRVSVNLSLIKSLKCHFVIPVYVIIIIIIIIIIVVVVKAAPLQTRIGPEGSRKLMLPDFMTVAQEGSQVVSLTQRPPVPGTHFG